MKFQSLLAMTVPFQAFAPMPLDRRDVEGEIVSSERFDSDGKPSCVDLHPADSSE